MNILITGAGKGIGFSLVKKFAEQKSNTVYAISRNIEKLNLLSKHNILPVSYDLNKLKTVDPNNNIIDKDIELDILINNAGLLVNKPLNSLSYDEMQNMLYVNTIAPALLVKRLMKQFKESGTHVINIGSMGGFQGSQKFPGLSIYSASKGALSVLTECLATEFQNTNHRFNCLAIGAVQTEMLQQAFPNYKAPFNSDEMASFIYDFAVNAGNYMNGKIIPVSMSNP